MVSSGILTTFLSTLRGTCLYSEITRPCQGREGIKSFIVTGHKSNDYARGEMEQFVRDYSTSIPIIGDVADTHPHGTLADGMTYPIDMELNII